jgi:hypothetical protein
MIKKNILFQLSVILAYVKILFQKLSQKNIGYLFYFITFYYICIMLTNAIQIMLSDCYRYINIKKRDNFHIL